MLDDATGARKSTADAYTAPTYNRFYRPRIEGLFARIERWVATDTGITIWRSISRDNVTTLYGYDAASRVADPNDPTKIFSWQICRDWDDKGNVASLPIRRRGQRGHRTRPGPRGQPHHATRAAQNYLKTVQYGNVEP